MSHKNGGGAGLVFNMISYDIFLMVRPRSNCHSNQIKSNQIVFYWFSYAQLDEALLNTVSNIARKRIKHNKADGNMFLRKR
jgi:hypothetical protein